MQYTTFRLLLSAAALLWLAPCVSAPAGKQQQKDSLRRVIARTEGPERKLAREQLARIYTVEIRKEGALDTLLMLYDALEADAGQAGDLKEQGTVKINRLGAYFNKGLYDEVIEHTPAVLRFLEENGLWKDYYQASNNLCETYRYKEEYEKALEEATGFYNHAKNREDRGGMGLAQLALAKIYSSQRRFAEAEKCTRECIGLLEGQTLYLNYLATAYNRLAIGLIGQERYDEALEVARATEDVNRRYEEASHTRQPSAWYNLWLTYTDIYRQTGEFDKAQRYVDKIDSITRGAVKMYKERGHILYGTKRYPEALEMFDKAIAASSNALEAKGLKLMTLAQMREPEKAVELFSEVINELETRHDEAFNARLDEIRTQYEVDKYVAEKERSRNYFLFALGGCILLAVLLGVTFYYNRVVTRKNIGLYRQIKEQDRLEEELAQFRAAAGRQGGLSAGGELPGDVQQLELVERLREYLLHGRNLMHAELNRNELTAALGTNRNTLSEAVRTVTGKTPMEYIRTMQLEEARRLLERHSELTIEAIAFDCGFNAPNTFYRLFRKHYGISPAEYRKVAGSFGK